MEREERGTASVGIVASEDTQGGSVLSGLNYNKVRETWVLSKVTGNGYKGYKGKGKKGKGKGGFNGKGKGNYKYNYNYKYPGKGVGKGLNYYGDEDYLEAWGNGEWDSESNWNDYGYGDGYLGNVTMMMEHGGFGEEEDRQTIKHKGICKTLDTDIIKLANNQTREESSELKTVTGGWNKLINTENKTPITVSNRFQIFTDDDDSDEDNHRTTDIESDTDRTNKSKRQPNKRQRLRRRQQQQQQQQYKQQIRNLNCDLEDDNEHAENGKPRGHLSANLDDDNQPITCDKQPQQQDTTTQLPHLMTHITQIMGSHSAMFMSLYVCCPKCLPPTSINLI